jgi:hypothetical protein
LDDIPAGTFVRIKWDGSGADDLNTNDGIISLFKGGGASLDTAGEQIILFSGTKQGAPGCGGIGTNSYIAGINWGNAGWNSGATNNTNSKAPGTLTDFALGNAFDETNFVGSVNGNIAALISTTGTGIRNPFNWKGSNNGNGNINLKDIKFHESNFLTGAIIFSNVLPASFTMDCSQLVFSNTNPDTRYLIVIRYGAAPDNPADRYTCYSGITADVTGTASVVTSVNSPPCGMPVYGNGKVVYFDYGLPSALGITGLNPGLNYQVKVVAVNGNGHTANMSSVGATAKKSTCVAPVIANVSSNSPICTSTGLSLGVTLSAGTAPLSYTWAGQGIFFPSDTIQNPSVNGAASGIYSVSVSNSCGSVSGNVNVVVNNSFTIISVTADSNGTVIPSGNINVPCFGSQSFSFSADSCYQIADVIIDGISQGAVNSYTFMNVQSSHSVFVLFAHISYTQGDGREDINKDGKVDNIDFLILLGKFGRACSCCPEDINADGMVNTTDLLHLISEFGN